MTVTVTLRDGATDNYMRFGDAYVQAQQRDARRIRCAPNIPHSYPAGAWIDVQGNENTEVPVYLGLIRMGSHEVLAADGLPRRWRQRES